MKRTQITVLLIVFSIFTAINLTAAGSQETGPEDNMIVEKFKPVTITDGVGRSITIDEPVERIVSACSDIGEIIKILGVEDMVVGVDLFTQKEEIIFPEMSKLPAVGNHLELDLEQILELDPDILLITSFSVQIEQIESIAAKLEPEVKVICLNFIDQTTFVHNFEILQKILGKENEGKAFLDFYTGTLSGIRGKVSSIPEEEKTSVYYEMYVEWYTFGNALEMYGIQLENAGGNNVAKDLEGMMVEVDREWLVEADPDVIVKVAYPEAGFPGVPQTHCGYTIDDPSGMQNLVDSVKARDALVNSSAVKNDRVFVRHYGLMETPRSFIGVVYMAKWFYPELFYDLDPKAVHQRYLSEFLGIDYDLSSHGVLAWPE